MIRALYPRKRPVEIRAVQVKTTAETLRQVISTARAQAASEREPQFAAISNQKRRVAC
jgi:hypothetical protein